MKFLHLISLLCVLSVIFTFQSKSQAFLKEADDDLNLNDNNSSDYENYNNELVKEDNFDNHDNDENRELSNNDTEFDQKALQEEIHNDLGSEKVSYKFDD